MPQLNTLFEFDAIGTHWWCESLDTAIDTGLQQALFAEAARFDVAYSRFKDDSLIMQLADAGELHHPPAELVDMLNFAKELHTVSNGAFDIGVGNILHKQGYGSRAHGSEIDHALWRHIEIHPDVVRIPKGIVLDLGGFGKGWLIDLSVDLFRAHGHTQFIINGGGDMYIDATEPIEIALEDPEDASKFLTKIAITGGFAASGQGKRRWTDGDTERAHIIDPKTGETARSVVRGTFVQAPTARLADAMATILFLQPDLYDALRERYQLKALVV